MRLPPENGEMELPVDEICRNVIKLAWNWHEIDLYILLLWIVWLNRPEGSCHPEFDKLPLGNARIGLQPFLGRLKMLSRGRFEQLCQLSARSWIFFDCALNLRKMKSEVCLASCARTRMKCWQILMTPWLSKQTQGQQQATKDSLRWWLRRHVCRRFVPWGGGQIRSNPDLKKVRQYLRDQTRSHSADVQCHEEHWRIKNGDPRWCALFIDSQFQRCLNRSMLAHTILPSPTHDSETYLDLLCRDCIVKKMAKDLKQIGRIQHQSSFDLIFQADSSTSQRLHAPPRQIAFPRGHEDRVWHVAWRPSSSRHLWIRNGGSGPKTLKWWYFHVWKWEDLS